MIFTIFQRFLIWRLLVISVVVVVGTCGPVILTAIFFYVPVTILYSNLGLWILYGIVPTTVYLTLPFAVAVGITWCYNNLAWESELLALFSSRYSPLGVITPALVVSVVATLIGYALSMVVAPRSVTQVHDVLYTIRHNLSPSLLDPNRFYGFNDGRRIFHFERWTGVDSIEGVFFHDVISRYEDYTLHAERGQFVKLDQETVLAVYDGSLQAYDRRTGEFKVLHFNRTFQRIGLIGAELPKRRPWTGVFELDTSDFLGTWAVAQHDRYLSVRWTSEAAKRFGIPLLAIAHTLLGLGLVLSSGVTRLQDEPRRMLRYYWTLLTTHVLILLTAEAGIFVDIRIAWLVVAFIVVEFMVGVFLLNGKRFRLAYSIDPSKHLGFPPHNSLRDAKPNPKVSLTAQADFMKSLPRSPVRCDQSVFA